MAHLGNCYRVEFVSAEQMILNDAQQYLARRRGGQAGAGQHIGCGIYIKTGYGIAFLCGLSRHTAHQCGGAFFFFFLGVQRVQRHLYHRPAFRLKTDGIGAVWAGTGQKVQIDRTGQDTTVLMVGVVAANFCATGGRAQSYRCVVSDSKGFLKFIQHFCDPLAGGCQIIIQQMG